VGVTSVNLYNVSEMYTLSTFFPMSKLRLKRG
jgi:hypothetical protein